MKHRVLIPTSTATELFGRPISVAKANRAGWTVVGSRWSPTLERHFDTAAEALEARSELFRELDHRRTWKSVPWGMRVWLVAAMWLRRFL